MKKTLYEKIKPYFVVAKRKIKGRFVKTITLQGMKFDLRDVPPIVRGINWNKWEKENREIIPKYIQPYDRVLELGGGLGIISCFINKHLDNPTNQKTVEANPDMIPSIVRNRNLNNCEFIVENAVYGSEVFYKTELFYISRNNYYEGNKIYMKEFKLKDNPQYNVLVCDIEGGEVKLFEEDLSQFDTMIIEFHNRIIGKEKVDNFLANLKTHAKVHESFHPTDGDSFVILKKI